MKVDAMGGSSRLTTLWGSCVFFFQTGGSSLCLIGWFGSKRILIFFGGRTTNSAFFFWNRPVPRVVQRFSRGTLFEHHQKRGTSLFQMTGGGQLSLQSGTHQRIGRFYKKHRLS